MLKFMRGYRTVIVAAVLGVVDIMQATDLRPIIPDAWEPIFYSIQPFVFLALRLITKGPVGNKEAFSK